MAEEVLQGLDPQRVDAVEAAELAARRARAAQRFDIVRERGGKWYVLSEDETKELGGPYDTEKEADDRLRQVDYFKHRHDAIRFDAHDVAAARRHTVAMMRMHRTIGTAQRRRRVGRAVYPKIVEIAYAKRLADIFDHGRSAIAPLIAELPALLASAAAARGDEEDPRLRVFAGLPIVIENPRGSRREWIDSDGTPGSTLMRWDYGFIDGVAGADGEEIDVYLGPDESSPWVFVVHQQSKSSGFETYDEDKVMLGWPDAASATEAYLDQYNDPRFFGGMSQLSLDAFKRRIAVTDGGKITHADRMDIGEGKRARELVDRARRKFEAAIHPNQLEALAHTFAQRTGDHQREQLKKQAKAALGIEVHPTDTRVPAIVDHFVGENVSLIKTLGSNTFDWIEKAVTRSVTTGIRHEELAGDIAERFNIGERHARLIARDQVGKLNAQLNASRSQEIGVESFIWQTVGDERVRDEHDEIDGEEFDYPEGHPTEGLPGEPILCRCSAFPVFNTIIEEADAEEEDAGNDQQGGGSEDDDFEEE